MNHHKKYADQHIIVLHFSDTQIYTTLHFYYL